MFRSCSMPQWELYHVYLRRRPRLEVSRQNRILGMLVDGRVWQYLPVCVAFE